MYTLVELSEKVINTLLNERTSGGIFNISPNSVLNRYSKKKDIQKERTLENAEVFTPFNIIKQMVDGFSFPEDDFEYISKKCIEGCCGEAPFLTTRYDVVSGVEIPIENRTGIVDRKLKHIQSNSTEEEWINLANIALKSTYGFEIQEDSLFIGRKNILLTTIEHFMDKFGHQPVESVIENWANIISYNLFKMDGLSMCLPKTVIPVKIMNWEKNTMVYFDGEPHSKPLF